MFQLFVEHLILSRDPPTTFIGRAHFFGVSPTVLCSLPLLGGLSVTAEQSCQIRTATRRIGDLPAHPSLDDFIAINNAWIENFGR